MYKKKMFSYIEAEGTPYEIGLTHGSAARDKITGTIENYRTMFMRYSNIDWEAACKYAETFIPSIEEYDKDIMDEIRGIAEGAERPLNEILALNVRSEIVLQGGQVGKTLDGGCTSFAITPSRSTDGNTWLAQNWDWRGEIKESCIIIKIKQSGKPNILMVTEAGIVGKIGLNEAGLGVCLNALASDQYLPGKTVPLHIALRGVLNSASLSDAIYNAARTDLACCANFLTASASGQAVSMEISRKDMDVIYADNGFVPHTNHFYGPKSVNVHDTGRYSVPDSFLRLGRIRELIAEKGDNRLDFKDMKNILSDHVGYPESICRHENPKSPPDIRLSLCTVFSIIMNLDERKVFIAEGNPCRDEYSAYYL